MKRYEMFLENVKDTVMCPNCGLQHNIKMLNLEIYDERYVPFKILCFDGEPQGKGCMTFFELFVFNDKLIVRSDYE